MLAVVRTCSTLEEAEVIGSLLRAAGLQAAVCNQHVANYAPGAYYALGGFRVTVPALEAAEAAEVLETAESLAADTADEPEPVRIVDGLTTILSFWMGWFVGVPFVRKRAWRPPTENRCRRCEPATLYL